MDGIADLISPAGFIPALAAATKERVLELLAERAAAIAGLDSGAVIDAVTARERLGTTGVGNGIAIPHARLSGLDRSIGILARLTPPVDFAACDDWPVDLVFLLLSPAAAEPGHLMMLARISRLLRDQSMCAALRRCRDAEEMARSALGSGRRIA